MQNTSSTKIPIQFQGGMAGSFGINPPLGLLNVSGNNLSESFSDHNNGKSQDPISFLSSDRKDLSALQNRPSIEGKSPENFEMRGSAVQNSRTEIGPVSDYSARNSAKSPQNKPRVTDSTQYFTGGGAEAKGLSKAFTSISKDISENHTRKSSRNKEVQKSCVISSFMPSEIEFDGIRLSPDSRRRESKKSTVSSRDIPSQSDLDSDLISRLDTDRFYADKKMGTKRKSPMKEEYSTGKYHEGYHHTRGNKSVVPSVSDGDYLLDQAGNLNYNKAFEGVPTFKQNTEKKGGYNEASEKKARNERLEAKFENMESLMQQMKVFQEKLYQNYKEAKDEVQKEAVEKLNIINNLSQDNNQSEKLRIKINELQKQVKVLTDENHHLKDSNQKKTDVIGKLEDQVKAARSEIAILKEKHEAKIESLMMTIKKLEKENLDPSHNREKSRGGDVHYKRDLRINTSDLMDRSREDRSSYKERDTTETSMESKNILRERFSLDNNDERMYQIQKELNKYRDEIEFLRRENKKLRTELHGNTTHGRRSADLRTTVQPFENLLDNSNNLMTDNKKLPDANMMFKVLTDISIEVEVENIAGIYPKVKEIQEENRTNKKFVDSFLDLVYRCSPSGSFEKRPNLKQAWKWMKRLMEEYMEMRKEGKEYPSKEDNTGKEMKEIASCLGVKTKDGIMDKIRELMSENSLMGKVISKMKSVYSIELSVPLGELDKRLELAMTTNGRMVNKQESRYTNLPLKMDNH